ncbi:MAG: type II secretion system protein, partial [Planctomycetia bacterium]|nr:type II secretion system protein [Planctomycetia bacterium]
MNRRPAFTLIEMLTVIGILSCLTGLMVPALTVTKDIAEQTFCAANLSNIGTALYVYADNHAGFLPDCGASSTLGGPVPADGKHFADAWDSPGTARYPSVQSAGNQGNLWLLVREGYLSAAAFTCPSTADSPSLNPADDVAITGFYQMDAAGAQPTPAEAQFLQEFSAGRCSYSFQNQFVHPVFD